MRGRSGLEAGRDARMSKVLVAHHVTREIGQHVLHIVAHSPSTSLEDQLKAALNGLVEAEFDVLAPQFHHEPGVNS